MSEWISVKDKFPLYKQVVLVFLDTEQIAEAVYRGEYDKDDHIFRIELTREDTSERVTHWMPLPETPTCKHDFGNIMLTVIPPKMKCEKCGFITSV